MKRFWYLYASLLFIANSCYVWSSCANKSVRPNSPCNTTNAVCEVFGLLPQLDAQGQPVLGPDNKPVMFIATVNCGNTGGLQFPNTFQCDSPNSGTDCQGSSFFVPCTTTWNCTKQPNPTDPLRQVICNPGQQGSSTTGETKVTVSCSGTPGK